ncbi:hypothetical protein ACWD4G_26250 [Streptomyces sp. NPDC002643]
MTGPSAVKTTVRRATARSSSRPRGDDLSGQVLAANRGLRDVLLRGAGGRLRPAAARDEPHPMVAAVFTRAQRDGRLRDGIGPTDFPLILDGMRSDHDSASPPCPGPHSTWTHSTGPRRNAVRRPTNPDDRRA